MGVGAVYRAGTHKNNMTGYCNNAVTVQKLTQDALVQIPDVCTPNLHDYAQKDGARYVQQFVPFVSGVGIWRRRTWGGVGGMVHREG